MIDICDILYEATISMSVIFIYVESPPTMWYFNQHNFELDFSNLGQE